MSRGPRHSEKLEMAMRFIYSHFLAKGESLAGFMTSRVHPRPNIRHLVRKKLYHIFGCRYKDIARAEAACNGGTVTDTGTISYSVHKPVEAYDNYQRAHDVVLSLIEQFESYWVGLQEEDIRDRLGFYYGLPHHVLAVMACFAECYGWVEKIKMEGLYTEWKTISRELIEQEIQR